MGFDSIKTPLNVFLQIYSKKGTGNEIWHGHKYSDSADFAQYQVEVSFEPIQPYVFLEWSNKFFHTLIWGNFSIPPCRSYPPLSGWIVDVGEQPSSGLSWEVRSLVQPLKNIRRVVLKPLLHYFSCDYCHVGRRQSTIGPLWGCEHYGKGFYPVHQCTRLREDKHSKHTHTRTCLKCCQV